jgi:hypothetical protein
MLNKALILAERADGFTKGWLATWRADQYATSGKLDNAWADIDLSADGLYANESGNPPTAGFFARATYGYGMKEHLDSVRGLAFALAGKEAEAERTFAAVDAQAANMRRRIATLGHQALAHVKTDVPEAACSKIGQAAGLAVEHHYGMGWHRALGVRAGYKQAWSNMRCVGELDEHIRELVRQATG